MRKELDRVQVNGFKSIESLDLSLNRLNVFIGANGAGKSNFISLFQLISRIVNKNLQIFVGESGGPDALLRYGRKTTNELQILLGFGRNTYQCVLVPTMENRLIFREEKVTFWGEGHAKPYEKFLGSSHIETKLWDEVSQFGKADIASFAGETMSKWQIYHFQDTSVSAKVKQLCPINDNQFLRPDASNLAAFLYLLQQTHMPHYRNIVETISLAAPFFHDFDLRPSPLNANQIQLEWREKGSDAYFNAYSLSDGTLRFICLATLLLQPQLPATIILDEPELGLHPYAINLLAGMLREASQKSQVIVSTQSVTLVNQFEPEDIIVVDRKQKRSEFRRLQSADYAHWLDEYGLGELWEKNILGGRPSHEG